MHLRGGQDENGVGGRLLKRFQQGIKGRCGEHMNFVNDIDFVLPLVGSEVDLFAQVAHIFDGSV